MNDKLSLQDLVDLLSKKANITKKDADSFFREFFQLILERIFDNDIVKVKDFGTFKLVSINSRESINVNTGEKFEIPSHYKFSFIPDKVLKNLVNKPFSQFETILLEDGVIFDASVEDEEGFEDDEIVDNTDFENEDENSIVEIENPIIAESASTIPNLVEAQVKEEDISTQNDFQIESPNFPHIPVEVSVEDTQLGEDQEEMLRSTPLVENVISDDLELESDAHSNVDSEIEIEEDISITGAIRIIETQAKDEKELTHTTEIPSDSKMEKKPVSTNKDTERPLYQRKVDELVSDVGLTSSDKPAETNNVVPSDDTIEPMDTSSHNYNKPSFGPKIWKALPIILFVLGIIVFVAYGLIRILNKPYDFEAYLGKTNLTYSDTARFVEEVTPKTSATDVMLDSMKNSQTGVKGDTTKMAKKESLTSVVKEPTVQQKTETPKVGIVGDADSLTKERIISGNNSFVISDKLSFSILNKAEFHLNQFRKGDAVPTSNSQNKNQANSKASSSSSSNSKANYTTLKEGMTLRTIATTYYGNPAYWIYIYQANKKKISNPNRMPAGINLLVPPLSDYGVTDPKDPKAIQAAKKLEAQTFSVR